MTTTITAGIYTITPDVVDGFSSVRRAGNIMHPVLGSDDVDVTYRPAKLRTGTLRLVFTDESDALEAELLHATGTVFVVASTDRDAVEMTYAVAGDITLDLDDETRDVWFLGIPYQEVVA